MNESRMFEFDAITGESNYRDLTAEEVKEFEAIEKDRLELEANRKLKEKAKADLLDRLGITEEEAKLLLG